MINSRMFLKAFVAITFLVFLIFYQMEGAIKEIVNRVVQRLVDPHLPISENLALALTTLYVALCGLVLPTPAELPLLLTTRVELLNIILASALGKSIGTSLLFAFCSLGLRFGKHDATDLRRSLASGRAGAFFEGKRVGITYALCQAVPFAPMRSATVGYSIVAPLKFSSFLVVVASSFLGTISRMLLIWGFAQAGIAVLS